jgi:hypothetical protein
MDLAELDAGFTPETPTMPQDGVRATFYYHTLLDEDETKKEGRPIYKEHVYARIIVAGDRSNILERPATTHDRVRFPVQFQQFLAREEQKSVGYPLAEWAGISRALVEELKFFHIHTVEELAAVSDVNGQKFHQFMALRERAKVFLQELEDSAPREKMLAELADRDAKIALLMQQQADMIEEMKALRVKKEK